MAAAMINLTAQSQLNSCEDLLERIQALHDSEAWPAYINLCADQDAEVNEAKTDEASLQSLRRWTANRLCSISDALQRGSLDSFDEALLTAIARADRFDHIR